MRQAITTTYYATTNFHGARITARAAARRVVMPYDQDLSFTDNHICAAMQLAVKFGWKGKYHGGAKFDGVYVFVAETGDDKDGFKLV